MIFSLFSYSVRLYYDHGECLALRVASGDQEEVQEIVDRLRVVSTGCEVRWNSYCFSRMLCKF